MGRVDQKNTYGPSAFSLAIMVMKLTLELQL